MSEDNNMRFTTVLLSILALLGIGAGGTGLYFALESKDAVSRLESHIVDVEQRLGGFPEELQKVNNRIFNLSQGVEGSVNAARAEVAAVREELFALTNRPAPPPPAPLLEMAPEGPTTDEASPSSSGGQYVIKSGDNFGKIAKAHGTTTAAIQKANPGVDPAKLKIGQKINLP